MQKPKTILWDFNGTLLDDAHICIDAINILLRNRGKREIDMQTYRKIFTFPVREYYIRAGFDFIAEPFEKPAMEFIDHYDIMVRKARLFDDVEPSLKKIKERGCQQMVLSAMQQDFLDVLIDELGVRKYFGQVSGIDNHYADGKTETARKLVNGLQGEVLLIGDTLHDFEVASELGIGIILVARGHQSRERLEATGAAVVATLGEVVEMLKTRGC